jgi:DNA-binding XRE family transcriptional regulator
MADKTAKGRQSRPQGEKHPMRKLTDEMVKQIRHLRATTNLKQIEIAKQFGVSNTVISRIENNVLWSHL